MAKLIILSIVIISFVLPIAVSTTPRPRRVLRRVQVLILISIVIWAYLCLTWYTRLVQLD
ncbi:MAG: hypothetical protein ACREJ3_15835 [Polyangiaceae bacterium]